MNYSEQLSVSFVYGLVPRAVEQSDIFGSGFESPLAVQYRDCIDRIRAECKNGEAIVPLRLEFKFSNYRIMVQLGGYEGADSAKPHRRNTCVLTLADLGDFSPRRVRVAVPSEVTIAQVFNGQSLLAHRLQALRLILSNFPERYGQFIDQDPSLVTIHQPDTPRAPELVAV